MHIAVEYDEITYIIIGKLVQRYKLFKAPARIFGTEVANKQTKKS